MFTAIQQLAESETPAVAGTQCWSEGPFNSDLWGREIQDAVVLAANEDCGALEWCRQNRLGLYQQCTTSLRAVDDAYSSRDAKTLQKAIQEFLKVHREAVSTTKRYFLNNGGRHEENFSRQ